MELHTKQHKRRLSLVNFDKFITGGSINDKMKSKHSELLPNSIRSLLCGPSGCGKTNVLFNLLFSENGLKFENLYVFSKSLYQKKYKFLEKIMSEIPEIGYFPFSENDQVIHPNEAEPNSIMIFDDVSCEKQHNIRNYFAMGRHKNIDSFYLCQTYSSVPKQLIRDNANLIVAFRQDDRNLKHIYHDHVNTDFSYDKFKELCAHAWKDDRHSFLVINKECDLHNGRYRIGFDNFIQV